MLAALLFIYMYIHVSYFCSKYRLCVHTKKKSLELPLSEAVLMSTQNPCLSKKKKKKKKKERKKYITVLYILVLLYDKWSERGIHYTDMLS